MKFGLFMVNGFVCADPAVAAEVVKAAEASGWESAWTGEHYVLPDPPTGRQPRITSPRTPFLDPFVSLAFLAAHTTTLKLGTGVTVVPLHNPLILAKEVATLVRASRGRFLFGVGVGYLEPEFRALGVPLAGRGARTVEYLDAMSALWSGKTGYSGTYVDFRDMRAEPAIDAPPIHFGGEAPQTYARVVERGHGWYGFWLDPAAAGDCVRQLREAAETRERPAELGKVEVSVTPDQPLSRELVEAYERAGVDRLIVVPPRGARDDRDALLRFVEAQVR
ncbi:TIGR03619 family F420-dependent LLM class oxidoreductase [Fodinicola acaciae]|uniref:TIGR03619 family F420-dependent LLM class oxidoreductase n=1 Tax=Fodinicola acaciae TaxID=2681555 RepID=UPI0013D52E02|nr:TIGR03619 family F420-dependent LLM class oxidoreductase [Fodinicola acaciae]